MANKIPKPIGDAKLPIFEQFDLDVNEIIMVGCLAVILPLFTFTLGLTLVLTFMSVGMLWAIAGMLFFVKYDGENMFYWLRRLVPFWLKQRVYRTNPPGLRLSSRFDLVDRISYRPQLNHLSFAWQLGDDGRLELHIYESPLIPALLSERFREKPSSLPTRALGDA